MTITMGKFYFWDLEFSVNAKNFFKMSLKKAFSVVWKLVFNKCKGINKNLGTGKQSVTSHFYGLYQTLEQKSALPEKIF